jgi:hypothetical protein
MADEASGLTVTCARKMTVRYSDLAPEPRPATVWLLDDGRVIARWQRKDGSPHEYLFPSFRAFDNLYTTTYHDAPFRLHADTTDETEIVTVAAMPRTYAVTVDWAAIHHALCAIDHARRNTQLGYGPSVGDAFGGEYVAVARPQTLAVLVRHVHAVDRIARDAWELVHQATLFRTDLNKVRKACATAIACSHAYSLFHRAGLIDDPKNRICGTGEGYGLTGLHWLAGRDQGATSAEVEAFAAGGELPAAAEEQS